MEPIQFFFRNIQILSKYLKEPAKDPLSGVFNFSIRIENRVKPENNLVIPIVFVEIRDGNKPELLARFSIACLFEIVDFASRILYNEENQSYDIPKELNSIFQPVSISTARGVIFSELRATQLHNAIMPVVFMDQIKPEENQTPQKEMYILI
jgi:hypothetical protein